MLRQQRRVLCWVRAGTRALATARTRVQDVYQRKTPVEHVLLRPETYVGAVERTSATAWVWDARSRRMSLRQVSFVPALCKVFDEILVNAADNVQRDPRGTTEIRVSIDRDSGGDVLRVRNNGRGMPVQRHPVDKVYVPELCLGHLLTGSNFDDTVSKVTGGRNGYGAKLTNIFSREFSIETADSRRGLLYTQEPPVISPLPKGTADYTLISFRPDLSRFSMSGHIDADHLGLLRKRVVDIAGCNPSLDVYLNDKLIPISSMSDYFALYGPKSRDPSNDIVFARGNKRWHVGVTAAPDAAAQHQVSFVNSIATTRGGTHVNHVLTQLTQGLASLITRRHRDLSITPAHVRPHVALFVSALIENPTFDSQTKERLTTQPAAFGGTEFVLSDAFIRSVADRTDIVSRVVGWARAKQRQELSRSLGRKSASASQRQRVLGIPKLDDANWAGGPRSSECTLILTEGDSAKALAVAGLAVVGRDRYGVYPLRGKLLNVRDASHKQIVDNAELANIARIMGLSPAQTYAPIPAAAATSDQTMPVDAAAAGADAAPAGADADAGRGGGGVGVPGAVAKASAVALSTIPRDGDTSSWPAERKRLRYGRILLMTDQDHDGSHIKGLFLNYLHYFWPELLRSNDFVEQLVTPILRVSRPGQRTRSFYSIPEYEEWIQHVPDKERSKYRTKYYKGLGTSTSAEAKEYFRALDETRIRFIWPAEAKVGDDLIDMVFNKSRSNERKSWLLGYQADAHVDYSQQRMLPINEFVNKELIAFSHADNIRSIPSVVDGLKPGQRKVIYACFKRKLDQEMKVAQLAGYVGEHTAYHHGEASLHGTIIGLAQVFPGSNNVPLLQPIGQFGTRQLGGKDCASARYISTALDPLARALFRPEDDGILVYQREDEQVIQPDYYLPVIPTVLVNGAEGLGTGWSTQVPCFNPLDVINNVRRCIHGDKLEPMLPWFRGWHGSIFRKQGAVGTFVTRGKVHVDKQDARIAHVTELPVRRWTHDFKENVLEALVASSNSLVQSFSEYHTEHAVHFVLQLARDMSQAEVEEHLQPLLKLDSYVSTRNMHLFDADHQIRKYDSAEEIITAFCAVRLPQYARRREHLLAQLDADWTKLDQRARFTELVVGASLSVFGRPHAQVLADMQTHGLAGQDWLLATPISALTAERVTSMQQQLARKREEIDALRSTTPQQLWLRDLALLEDAWQVWLRADEAEHAVRSTYDAATAQAKRPVRRRRRQPAKAK